MGQEHRVLDEVVGAAYQWLHVCTRWAELHTHPVDRVVWARGSHFRSDAWMFSFRLSMRASGSV